MTELAPTRADPGELRSAVLDRISRLVIRGEGQIVAFINEIGAAAVAEYWKLLRATRIQESRTTHHRVADPDVPIASAPPPPPPTNATWFRLGALRSNEALMEVLVNLGNRRGWKRLGDLRRTDCELVCRYHDEVAASMRSRSAFFQALAQRLDGERRVRDVLTVPELRQLRDALDTDAVEA